MSIIEGAVGRTFQVAGVPSAGTDEVQTLTPSGLPTGGTFAIGFNGHVSAGIPFDDAAAAILTALELIPGIGSGGLGVTAVKAEGILTIAEPVTDGDQFTIAGIEYTLLSSFVDAVNNIFIGADEAATKVNIVAALNASGGTPGTTHFTDQVANPLVTVATFAGDVMTISARQVGVAGDAIDIAETGQGLTHAANIFNAATLGTTTAGAEIVVTFDGADVAKKAQSLLVLSVNAFTGGTTPTVAIAETTPGVEATARGAGIGAQAVDTTSGIHYSNTGTAQEPVWTVIGDQT